MDNRKIKILHVVGWMHRAGTETWLMNVLRNIDRNRFQLDFLTHRRDAAHYDAEIRALGGNIIPCLPSPFGLASYAANFRRVLNEHGPYDIVHSHPHQFSAWTLSLARLHGVPVRIAHSHSDTLAVDHRADVLRRLYIRVANPLIRRNATCGLAASEPAARSLFGPDWESDPKWRVMHCSLDLTRFRASHDRDSVRKELGIPPDAFVIGHVGRFEKEKNHFFLIRVLGESARQDKSVWGLMVGTGSLVEETRKKVLEAGLANRVVFAGVREDVPRLMLGAMDCFLFPSLYEGLGLVLVEAQAAGLPCLISDVIPEEADIVPGLIRRLSLQQPASDWSSAVLSARNIATIGTREALQTVLETDFNIELGIRRLMAFYSDAVDGVRTPERVVARAAPE